MLKHPSALPALSAADAFGALTVDEVSGCRSGKAVLSACDRWGVAEPQLTAQGGKPLDQPTTGLLIGLVALTRSIWPNQCVGETTLMQHSISTTRSAHQGDLTGSS